MFRLSVLRHGLRTEEPTSVKGPIGRLPSTGNVVARRWGRLLILRGRRYGPSPTIVDYRRRGSRGWLLIPLGC